MMRGGCVKQGVIIAWEASRCHFKAVCFFYGVKEIVILNISDVTGDIRLFFWINGNYFYI